MIEYERQNETGQAAQTALFTLTPPQSEPVPFLVNSPHSGEMFPAPFLERSQLSLAQLRRASDLYVERLIASAPRHGARLMAAHLPRSYIDLNREPFELDPRLIDGVLPPEANSRSLRVAGGLGTVPRVIGDQVEIYAGKLGLDEVLLRIEQHYLPYHRRLYQELAGLHAAFGQVVLIDCHSMPSQTGRGSLRQPDLVLGDRFGRSCAPELMAEIEDAARAQGLSVAKNQPYAGGYITEYYGHPQARWHAVQVEINRALYMDERLLTPHAGFFACAEALEAIFLRVFAVEPFAQRNSDLHFYQKAAE